MVMEHGDALVGVFADVCEGELTGLLATETCFKSVKLIVEVLVSPTQSVVHART